MMRNTESPPIGIKLFQLFGILAKLFGFIFLREGTIFFIASQLFNIDLKDFELIIKTHPESLKVAIIVSFIIGSLLAIILLPILYIRYFNTDLIPALLPKKNKLHIYLLLGLLAWICSMPFIGALNVWNQS